jgi:hypothetical protein
MMENNYAAALPDLDQAIALRPTYVNALMNRGDIYNFYFHQDNEQAIHDYNRVIALGGDRTTSVCGHRWLAVHHGWNIGTVVSPFMAFPSPHCSLKSTT